MENTININSDYYTESFYFAVEDGKPKAFFEELEEGLAFTPSKELETTLEKVRKGLELASSAGAYSISINPTKCLNDFFSHAYSVVASVNKHTLDLKLYAHAHSNEYMEIVIAI